MRRFLTLLVAGLLAASVAAPAVMAAPPGSNIVQVQPPNGTDDTANIQNALDTCVGKGPNCTVQLQAGTYYTTQLVTYNFRGTFRGAGRSQTTISALPRAVVNWPDMYLQGQCLPNLVISQQPNGPVPCRWGSFIIFVDGNIEVSDLTVDFPYTNGDETTTWYFNGQPNVGFTEAFKFLGDRRTDVSVDRVSVTGRQDTTGGAFGLGYNVMQGIYFAGDLPSSPYLAGPPYGVCPDCQTYATLTGTFIVRSSSVRSVAYGILTGGMSESGMRVTIGGSRSDGNRVDDSLYPINVGSESSMYEISYNTVSSASGDGVFVGPLNLPMTPGTHSQFFIHDNAITTDNPNNVLSVGIHVYDTTFNATTHWVQAVISHNTIQLTNAGPYSEGIDVNNAKGVLIMGNTVTGTGGGDAISLWGNDPSLLPTTDSTVAANDVSGFTVDQADGLAQIYLDPYTANNHVVCAGPGVSVLDQGTDNHVTGCGTANPKGGGHHLVAPGQLKPKLHP